MRHSTIFLLGETTNSVQIVNDALRQIGKSQFPAAEQLYGAGTWMGFRWIKTATIKPFILKPFVLTSQDATRNPFFQLRDAVIGSRARRKILESLEPPLSDEGRMNASFAAFKNKFMAAPRGARVIIDFDSGEMVIEKRHGT